MVGEAVKDTACTTAQSAVHHMNKGMALALLGWLLGLYKSEGSGVHDGRCMVGGACGQCMVGGA